MSCLLMFIVLLGTLLMLVDVHVHIETMKILCGQLNVPGGKKIVSSMSGSE